MFIKNKRLIIILSLIIIITLFSLWFYDSIKIKSSSSKEIKKIVSFVKPETVLESPSITKIFDDNHQWIATLSADKIRIITATGDIIPARSVNYQVMSRKNPLWPYEKVVPILKNKKSDLTLINLETPFIKNCPLTMDGMIFCGDQKNIEGLKYLGVNVANLANNHSGNYGIEGLNATIKLLNDNAMATTGTTDNLIIKDIKGLNFAFLGFNALDTNSKFSENIKSQIEDAKQKADIVIVSFHWGTEYQSQPIQQQIDLAHLVINSGADLIIGNHPHWIEPVEIYKGKYITYAHGNFVFDQMWSEKTKEGVIGRYVFYDKQLVDVEFLPIHIDNYGQASFGDEKYSQSILEEMKNESLKLKTNLQ